jgi:hypothetical protein
MPISDTTARRRAHGLGLTLHVTRRLAGERRYLVTDLVTGQLLSSEWGVAPEKIAVTLNELATAS